ncbi:MAG: GatB/YqeY domain-containing protein [Mariprofundaceae bacterium]|nr:GatB/YqeY domain-containing protein [Mariprofundaceae bacterium]
MLTQTLINDMKAAMKKRDKVALNAIRMLRAAIKDYEIAQGKDADDQAVISLISKQAKKHKEAIIQFSEAGRDELAQKEEQELKTLEVYLPKQLSSEEIQSMVTQVVSEISAQGMKDMGNVMQKIRPMVVGKADMSLLSDIVKKALQ